MKRQQRGQWLTSHSCSEECTGTLDNAACHKCMHEHWARKKRKAKKASKQPEKQCKHTGRSTGHQSSTRAVEVKNGGTSATTQDHVGCSALGERPSARIYNTWCMCNIYTKKKNVPLYLDSSPWLFHREKPQKWKRGEKMNGRFRDTCERRIGISIWEWLVHSIPHFFFFSFLLFKISQHVHNH